MSATEDARLRPLGLVLASIGAAAVGLLLTGFAVASVAQGHGTFSGAIGIGLGIYGLAMVAAAWALWRGLLLARGPLVATGVINVVVALSMAASAPLAWVVAAVSAASVVAVSLPSTSAGLRWRRNLTPPDGHPPMDDPGN